MDEAHSASPAAAATRRRSDNLYQNGTLLPQGLLTNAVADQAISQLGYVAMAIFLMLALVVLAAVFILGAALAILAAAITVGLVALGVLSMSALIAILHRSAKAGAQAMLYQIFGLCGLFIGCLAGVGICQLRDVKDSWAPTIVAGGVIGVLATTGICWCMVWVLTWVWWKLTSRWPPGTPVVQPKTSG